MKMNSLVSYGNLRPAFIGALAVVFGYLLDIAEKGGSPANLYRVEDLIEFSDSGIWGDESSDPLSDFGVIRVSDFKGDFQLNLQKAPLRAIAESKKEKFKLMPGDILVVKSSGSALQVVSGRVAVFEANGERSYAASNFLLRLRPKGDYDPHYLAYALGSPPIREQIANQVKTMTYPNLPYKLYKDLLLPIVPLRDQRQIASFFKAYFERKDLPELPEYLTEQRRTVYRIEELAVKVEEAKNLRRQAAAQIDTLFPSASSQVFGALDGTQAIVSLADITDRITKGESPEWQGFTYQEQGPLFIRSENVRWGQLDLSNAVHIPILFHKKLLRSQLKEGDVLINLVGASIGRCAVFAGEVAEANVNQAVAVISPSANKLESRYLMRFLNSAKTQEIIHGGKVETARPNISLGDLRALQIPLPSLAEQLHIVARCDALELKTHSLKKLQSETAAELDALMPSILAKAFRGEL